MTPIKIFLPICLLIGAVWAATYHSLFFQSVFAPKFEQVRRKTYTQSESYVRGTIQDLQKLQVEYLKEKDPDVKAALKHTIIQTASGATELTPELDSFISKIQ